MSLFAHCDGPRCEQTARVRDGKVTPNFNWRVVTTHQLGQGEVTQHYCSVDCEHAHTYLLKSGDNGK